MRKSLLVFIAAMLPALGALAEQPRLPNSGNAATPTKQLPLKGVTSSNSCAAYGAGFVRVEGTSTCAKIGGATSVGAGVSTGSR